ncbi:carboxymuconolactone decarboxylase family protein [Dermacoccaceae bacterium W4C1]
MTARISPGGLREIGLAATVFSRLAGRVTRTEPPAIFTTLGRTRRTYWGWLMFSATLMPFGSLARRESELVILRVAHLRSSRYEWEHHRRLGRRAGLTREQIAQLGQDTSDLDSFDLFDDRDRTMLAAVHELLETGDLADPGWTRLRAHLDERECIELLLLIGQYDGLARTLAVLRVQPDPPRSPRP